MFMAFYINPNLGSPPSFISTFRERLQWHLRQSNAYHRGIYREITDLWPLAPRPLGPARLDKSL